MLRLMLAILLTMSFSFGQSVQAKPIANSCNGENAIAGSARANFVEFKARVSGQPLLMLTSKRIGQPRSCQATTNAEVTKLVHQFGDGSDVEMIRMNGEIPSETTQLRLSHGLDQKSSIELMKQQMEFLFKGACKIDWAKSTVKSSAAGQERVFECADSGLNAHISLIVDKSGKGIKITSSFAL